jgi:hypothetical protein
MRSKRSKAEPAAAGPALGEPQARTFAAPLRTPSPPAPHPLFQQPAAGALMLPEERGPPGAAGVRPGGAGMPPGAASLLHERRGFLKRQPKLSKKLLETTLSKDPHDRAYKKGLFEKRFSQLVLLPFVVGVAAA